MKQAILLLFTILGIAQFDAQAQSYKFRTTGFSVLERNDRGVWGKWSDFQKADIVITLDATKNRIVVYSQEIQLYRIVSYEPAEENENDLIYPFTCMDDDGRKFTISIITRKNQGKRKQLYINQKDFIIAYNIVNMKS